MRQAPAHPPVAPKKAMVRLMFAEDREEGIDGVRRMDSSLSGRC
jgi:hypothetical protein